MIRSKRHKATWFHKATFQDPIMALVRTVISKDGNRNPPGIKRPTADPENSKTEEQL